MTQWARAPEDRQQMVLFSRRLDDALSPVHPVRLLDDILGRIDWSPWESRYHVRVGQPAIHPRVLAGVLLYGILRRIRSSRGLEEALGVRLDFRWLAEGRTIDHTTLSEFRRTRGSELKNLFVQLGLLAQQAGWLSLQELAFDGTRIRANNRRTGTRTPEELQQLKLELSAKFSELEARAAAEDAREEETFGTGSAHQLPAEMADVQRRREQVEAALAELQRVEAAGETLPKRLPLTDPQSRLTPNKEGGFAPNYTPLATVDMASGMIVSSSVIAMTNEDQHLVAAVEDVQQAFHLEQPPAAVLADGLMASGANLAALEEKGVALYSPVPLPAEVNPALRDDPSQPVPPEQWNQLPEKTVKCKGRQYQQLDKEAFVYDAGQDCYWCPQGQRLEYRNTTKEARVTGPAAERLRYLANPAACAVCPLRKRCLTPGTQRREVSHDQFEAHRKRHVQRMATPAAKSRYARRSQVCERPFAVIKQHYGVRQFLLRGLAMVGIEWDWLTTAFNLSRLMSLLRGRAGPPAALSPQPS